MASDYYKKWVNAFPCDDCIAACLIMNVNPDSYIANNLCVEERQKVEKLSLQLKNRMNPRVGLNIFRHLDNAIQNNFNLPVGLLEQIKLYYSNLLKNDKSEFSISYPYVARDIGEIDHLYNVVEPDNPLYSKELDIANQIQRKAVMQNITAEDMKEFVGNEAKHTYGEDLSPEAIKRLKVLLNPLSHKKGGRKKNKDAVS